MSKLLGIVGYPIGHSMSPFMHNDALAHLGINGYYHAFNVKEDQLKEVVEAFKTLGFTGFNVTIPHKVTIIDLLDEIDEEASLIGAVNTVVNSNGRLIGYNTDGRGYLKSLLTVLEKPLEQSEVLVIGAGGAARGVVAAIAKHTARKIYIANRTIEKAIEIKERVQRFCSTEIQVLTNDEAEKQINKFDIIINTTSIGMSPKIDEIPIPLNNIKAKAVVSDLIYNPLMTKWLSLAKKNGAIIHNGVGMFVEQGALGFEIWTGKQPNTTRMTELVMKHLGGKSC